MTTLRRPITRLGLGLVNAMAVAASFAAAGSAALPPTWGQYGQPSRS
jgi:hypothetical protein